MFSPRIGWKSLAVTCDSFAKLLDSGIPLRRTLKLTAEKTRDAKCQRALAAVRERVDEGDQIADAMRAQGAAFPPLMIDLISVAEMSGTLAEMFEHLRDHYESNIRLRRTFVGQIAWPLFQFTIAVFVIALLILVLGWIAESGNGAPIDFLGLGLFGVSGALTWLGLVFGSLFILFVTYKVVARITAGRAILHGTLLRVPVLGHCLRSFALARFSWSYYLTQQTGMSFDDSIEASLRATNNEAFTSATPDVIADVHAGSEFAPALAHTGLFPADYIEMVSIGETSGTVPETLLRLRPQLEESARRSLAVLTVALGWVVWTCVAGFIVYFVFRIVMSYVGMLQDLSAPG